jgi:coiled-coil domain-containing protein 12
VLSTRNFDPETRTLRRRAAGEDGDTVEAAVEGVVEDVLAEDEAREAQDLVRLEGAGRGRG